MERSSRPPTPTLAKSVKWQGPQLGATSMESYLALAMKITNAHPLSAGNSTWYPASKHIHIKICAPFLIRSAKD